MPSKKRPSPLPTLPQTETVEGFTLTLGGSNTYKKVKKNGNGFQGCNIGLRNNTDGMATDQCKDLCEGRSSETYFCKLSCGSYTTFLAARTPSKRKMAREAAKKLRIRKSEAADAEKDWSEDAMANELQTARDELGRLQSERARATSSSISKNRRQGWSRGCCNNGRE